MACQEWLTPRPWSGFSFPETRSVAVRLGGLVGSCPGRRPPHSRSTLFANGTTPLAAAPVHHTDRKPALYPTSAASGWQPSLLRCNAFALFSCVLSRYLNGRTPFPVPAEARQEQQSMCQHQITRITVGHAACCPFDSASRLVNCCPELLMRQKRNDQGDDHIARMRIYVMGRHCKR